MCATLYLLAHQILSFVSHLIFRCATLSPPPNKTPPKPMLHISHWQSFWSSKCVHLWIVSWSTLSCNKLVIGPAKLPWLLTRGLKSLALILNWWQDYQHFFRVCSPLRTWIAWAAQHTHLTESEHWLVFPLNSKDESIFCTIIPVWARLCTFPFLV